MNLPLCSRAAPPPGCTISFQDFYKSDAQNLYALLVVPLLFLLASPRLFKARGGLLPELEPFMRGYALVFTIETLADPLANVLLPRLLGEGLATGKLIPFFFVLAGDFRVLLLMLALTATRRPFLLAAALSFVVPILGQVTGSLIEAAGGPSADRTQWITYELLFLVLINLVHLRLRPRLASRPELARYLRALTVYVSAYYGLWLTSDLLTAAGADAGWALRVIPNQLYYAFYVPFAWFSFFGTAARYAATSTSTHASR